MADDTVLEHLRHIRGRVDQISEGIGEVKHRLATLERGQAKTLYEYAGLYEGQVVQQSVLDRVVARLERIERRLEITDS